MEDPLGERISSLEKDEGTPEERKGKLISAPTMKTEPTLSFLAVVYSGCPPERESGLKTEAIIEVWRKGQ